MPLEFWPKRLYGVYANLNSYLDPNLELGLLILLTILTGPPMAGSECYVKNFNLIKEIFSSLS